MGSCYNKKVYRPATGRETASARRSVRKFTVIVVVFVVSILFGGAAGMLAGYLRSAPTLDQVVFEQELTSYVYDVHGRRIASLYRENRIPVTLDVMPRYLLDAIVAIEDTRFYEHHGFDVRALMRAVVADVPAHAGPRRLFARRQHHHAAAGQERLFDPRAHVDPQASGAAVGHSNRAQVQQGRNFRNVSQ